MTLEELSDQDEPARIVWIACMSPDARGMSGDDRLGANHVARTLHGKIVGKFRYATEVMEGLSERAWREFLAFAEDRDAQAVIVLDGSVIALDVATFERRVEDIRDAGLQLLNAELLRMRAA